MTKFVRHLRKKIKICLIYVELYNITNYRLHTMYNIYFIQKVNITKDI